MSKKFKDCSRGEKLKFLPRPKQKTGNWKKKEDDKEQLNLERKTEGKKCSLKRVSWTVAKMENRKKGTSRRRRESKYNRIYKYLRVINPSHLTPSPSAYHIDDVLGEGGESVVYGALYKGRSVAVKVWKEQKKAPPSAMIREYNVMKLKKSHRHIVEIIGRGAFWKFPHFMVMELARCSLYDALQKELLPCSTVINIAFGIADGLHFLHTLDPPVLHRDLKSANVMLREDFTPFLVDFGLSKEIQNQSIGTKLVGTRRWMAPEMYDDEEDTTWRVDVYSFGMVLYELLTRKLPFSELKESEIPAAVRRGQRPKWPSIPPSLSGLVQMIELCWAQEPDSRPLLYLLRRCLNVFKLDLERLDRLKWLGDLLPVITLPSSLCDIILEYATELWDPESRRAWQVGASVAGMRTDQQHLYLLSPPKVVSCTPSGQPGALPFLSTHTFDQPWTLDVNQHKLYVLDSSSISIFDLVQDRFLAFYPLPNQTFLAYSQLKVDMDNFYVTSPSHSHEIYNRVTEWKTFGRQEASARPGEFHTPWGLTVDEKYLYVCDFHNHRIQVLFKESGEFYTQWGRTGERGYREDQFDLPHLIYLSEEEREDRERLFYIVDEGSVRIFSKGGECLQRIRESGLVHTGGICVIGNELFMAQEEKIFVYTKRHWSYS